MPVERCTPCSASTSRRIHRLGAYLALKLISVVVPKISICDVCHRHPSPAMSRIARNPATLGKRAEHMIELVSRARRLGREIAPVVGVDRAVQRHPPRDIDACAREPIKLARVRTSTSAKHTWCRATSSKPKSTSRHWREFVSFPARNTMI
jgi:hypothetical protein